MFKIVRGTNVHIIIIRGTLRGTFNAQFSAKHLMILIKSLKTLNDNDKITQNTQIFNKNSQKYLLY